MRPSPITHDTTDAQRSVDEDASRPPLVDVSGRPGLVRRVTEVWRYRELLVNLVRKELKVRYKQSVLGFVWSLLNPLLYLVVFSLVFAGIIRVQVPNFGIFLLSGLLAWNLLSGALNGGASAVVANAPLVQKVRFPREVLPLAAVGAAVVNFLLQLSVLLAALVVLRHAPAPRFVPVLLLAFVVLVIFSTALAIGASALNVRLRDTQHLIELVLLAWFWVSAIVYPYQLVAERLGDLEWITTLNPMMPIITAFQRTLHNPEGSNVLLDVDAGWYATRLGIVGLVSLVLLVGAMWLFGRFEDDFAEDL